MISELSIRNLAVVEAVDLSFEAGLHVLTGETGAGKSILVDAIALILGARSSVEFVRHGAKKAEISALFELSSEHPVWNQIANFGAGTDSDGHLLIKRDISHTGKSTCRVNGQIVTLSMLKQIGSQLMDIHGQHDHQSLLREEEHIVWLDAYAEESLKALKEQYRELYDEYIQVEKELHQLSESERDTAQRIDLLEFQVQEIAAAELVPGEDEQLQQRRTKLAHMEKLVQHMHEAYHALHSDRRAMNDISHALSQIETAAQFDPELNDTLELIRSAYFQLEEAGATLGRLADGQEFDQSELNEIEARLHVIEQLKRKYAPSVEAIIQYAEKVKQELHVLKNRESHVHELQSRLDELQSNLKDKARELSRIRRKAAHRLQQEVEQQLQDLHMKHTTFGVHFQQLARDEDARPFFPNGWDRLKFVISTNPGEPPKPLSKVASGGELSRIMLALKSIFHEVDHVGALIFDEIDTGVSGRTAQAIAEKMHRIARGRQVLCVTHLPQVACMADHHFYVSKAIESGNTVTYVHDLSQQERVNELARMLGGVEVTRKTKQHAEEMLRLAEKSKRGA